MYVDEVFVWTIIEIDETEFRGVTTPIREIRIQKKRVHSSCKEFPVFFWTADVNPLSAITRRLSLWVIGLSIKVESTGDEVFCFFSVFNWKSEVLAGEPEEIHSWTRAPT